MRTVNASPSPPLSIADFARLHGVIRTVLAGTGTALSDMTKSCVFFALAGAYLLEKRHGLRARPAFGAAFIAVAERNGGLDILSFAKRDADDDRWYSDGDAFHAWIEVTDAANAVWLVDLTSPLYPENIRMHTPGAKAPYKAFVQPFSAMLGHPDELQLGGRPGDFFVQANPARAADMMVRATSSMRLGDLVDAINAWYVPVPGAMPAKMLLGSSTGVARELTFTQPRLAGYWSAPGVAAETP
ncbi:hypothetical protein LMG31884_46880 (plasmid) [Xanthomonas hydrangeae]|uniref:DUF2026 family protein n=1 Tax=Xanthomonas hydrangeae TaxID=2775159 RepID=UPI001AFBBEEF|nr:hypothetical protein LMG31884_46880 [Xanthomonas hydrangeae]CAD7740613.1 hypothetical protein LMG31884_46880 [Xanthomonas hydrangeae]